MKKYAGLSLADRQQQFIERAAAIHNNQYDYSKVVYKNTHTPVIITCTEHGDFTKRPVKHITDREGCPTCAKESRVAVMARFDSFDQVVDAANDAHVFEYTYVGIDQSSSHISTNDKITIECPIHGLFIQTINKHIYQKTGCPQCFRDRNRNLRTKSTEQFIKDSIRIHGNRYTYDSVIYNGAHQPVDVHCPEHGIFRITPANHILHQQGCNMCSASSPEQIIAQTLTEAGIAFVHQYSTPDCISPVSGKQLRFDFFLPDHSMFIEYDGIYHYQPIDHGDGNADERFRRQQMHDNIKNEYAKKKGIQLTRIPFFVKDPIRDVVLRLARLPDTV